MSNNDENKLSRSIRRATLTTMSWVAERVRRASQIKKSLGEGGYQVDPADVAKSMLNN